MRPRGRRWGGFLSGIVETFASLLVFSAHSLVRACVRACVRFSSNSRGNLRHGSRGRRCRQREPPALVVDVVVVAPRTTLLAIVIHRIGLVVPAPPMGLVQAHKEFVGIQDRDARIPAQGVAPVDAQTRAGNLNPGIDLVPKEGQLGGSDLRGQNDKTSEFLLAQLRLDLGQEGRISLSAQRSQNNPKDGTAGTLLYLGLDLASGFFDGFVPQALHLGVVVGFFRQGFGVRIVAVELGNVGIGNHGRFEVKTPVGNEQNDRGLIFGRRRQSGGCAPQYLSRRQWFRLWNRDFVFVGFGPQQSPGFHQGVSKLNRSEQVNVRLATALLQRWILQYGLVKTLHQVGNVDGDFHKDVKAGNRRVLNGNQARMSIVHKKIAAQCLRAQVVDTACTVRNVTEDRNAKEWLLIFVGVANSCSGRRFVCSGYEPLQDVRNDRCVQQQTLGHLKCYVNTGTTACRWNRAAVTCWVLSLQFFLGLQNLVDSLEGLHNFKRVRLGQARFQHHLFQQDRVDHIGIVVLFALASLPFLSNYSTHSFLRFGGSWCRCRCRWRGGAFRFVSCWCGKSSPCVWINLHINTRNSGV
mmetsp:Transcript_12108/g.34680  ORF Transcript_12108/g.34680 Transcript_12108/m.34680 type:complete len:580 (-) Transcript_12108:101-1840(-)